MSVLLSALFAYLLGSISSAVVVSKLLRLPDPRIEGSGNPGATNVLRLSGKFPAALTLAGDVAKGIIPVLFAKLLTQDPAAVAMATLMAFAGHLYPVFFRFQGGKGVATALGAYLALDVLLFASVAGSWLLIALVFRFSSVASLMSMLSAPVLAWTWLENPWVTLATAVIFVFILVRHRSNIQRLLAGKESTIKLKKD